jgi:hypothetical protein
MPRSPVTLQDIDDLLCFLPLFDVPGRSFAHWPERDKMNGGAIVPISKTPNFLQSITALDSQPRTNMACGRDDRAPTTIFQTVLTSPGSRPRTKMARGRDDCAPTAIF